MKKNRVIAVLLITLLISVMAVATVYASDANVYAEKGALWILDGVFWVVVTIAATTIGMCAVKKNLTGALSTILAAAIALVIIKNPTILENLGTVINGILGLGSGS